MTYQMTFAFRITPMRTTDNITWFLLMVIGRKIHQDIIFVFPFFYYNFPPFFCWQNVIVSIVFPFSIPLKNVSMLPLWFCCCLLYDLCVYIGINSFPSADRPFSAPIGCGFTVCASQITILAHLHIVLCSIRQGELL
jgi:hypothetical protein